MRPPSQDEIQLRQCEDQIALGRLLGSLVGDRRWEAIETQLKLLRETRVRLLTRHGSLPEPYQIGEAHGVIHAIDSILTSVNVTEEQLAELRARANRLSDTISRRILERELQVYGGDPNIDELVARTRQESDS